ncbi:hypothetical protein PAHAL_5G302200 [Panicum hallii]|uniref:Uncharacterized protein n=1 Tax=Panicum hallii TaxID=206008 RepID=A0A2T8ILR5_9POAL|nr:hypothetical protein PAHAL_5G302200 [Panicum hallii]
MNPNSAANRRHSVSRAKRKCGHDTATQGTSISGLRTI